MKDNQKHSNLDRVFDSIIDFNKTMLGENITWFDRNGLMRLSKDGLVAKLALSTKNNASQMQGYKLTIISKSAGVIDGKFFNFDHYFTPTGHYYLDIKTMRMNRMTENQESFKKVIHDYINIFNNK